MKRIKTLFLAPQVPWPLDVGSKIRVHNLVRCYAELGEVTLVCFAQSEAEAQNVAEIERHIHRVYWFSLAVEDSSVASPVARLRTLSKAMHSVPAALRHFRSVPFASKVESLLATEFFDILHVERLYMVENVRRALQLRRDGHRPFRVLDVDDLESRKMRQMANMEPWVSPRKYLRSLECLKLYAYERRFVSRFDCVLVCSEKDRQLLQRGPRPPRVEVFSNGADVDGRPVPEGRQDDGRTLVFLGAMNYEPNEDAALFFAESVLPLVRRRVPDARFIVAGKSPSARVRAMANGQDVLVTGYIQDKTALFSLCTVFVVPIRIGGGTRIKILEAMAAGKPVVSTTVGCEGIDVATGEDILIADHTEHFAHACVDLLLDERRRRALGRAGRELVVRKYRWDEIRRGYVKVLHDCARRAGRTFHPSGKSDGILA